MARASMVTWIRAAVWLTAVAIAVLGAWATKFGTLWPSIYFMTGPSMEPTLAAREYFMALSPPDRIALGDLVLFRYEDADGVFHVLRRLVALPGDTVAMDSGVVILNGVAQSWPFRIMKPAASRSEFAIEGTLYDWGPWIVPTDSAVLLADTRDMIGWPDSRFLGFIALDDILARATKTLTGRRLR